MSCSAGLQENLIAEKVGGRPIQIFQYGPASRQPTEDRGERGDSRVEVNGDVVDRKAGPSRQLLGGLIGVKLQMSRIQYPVIGVPELTEQEAQPCRPMRDV